MYLKIAASLTGERRKFRTMLNKQNLFRLIILLLVSCIVITNISASGCRKRNRDKSAGSSSSSTFRINAPSNLVATAVSLTRINLSWADNSNNEDFFSIERSTGNDQNYSEIATVGANATSYSNPNLLPKVTYYYKVRAFGVGEYSSYSNQAYATTFELKARAIEAGAYHSIALITDGTFWIWGGNGTSQLGLGDTLDRLFPSQISTETDWDNVSGGGGYTELPPYNLGHTLAGKIDGTLWSWGNNGLGQLGLGDYYETDIPTQIGTDSDWSRTATGWLHTIALKTDGTLWSCGYNADGELGLGDTIDKLSPNRVGNDADWSMISAGYRHTLAIKGNSPTGGTLWAWGLNSSGQLGFSGPQGGPGAMRTTPNQIGNASDWSMVTAGAEYSIALKTNRSIWSWGLNDAGQLGLGTSGAGTNRNTPSQISTASDWVEIDGGNKHTLARKTNNTIWSWGGNQYGQLGLGNVITRSVPTQVGTTSDWLNIKAGEYHTIGLKTDGTIWSWGENQYGQLGLGDTINRNAPRMVGE